LLNRVAISACQRALTSVSAIRARTDITPKQKELILGKNAEALLGW
jgi:hypothetical protein